MPRDNDLQNYLQELLTRYGDNQNKISHEGTAQTAEEDIKPGVRNPFKFLDPYTEKDSDIFFGRETETKELYYKVFSNKITVLFGESGVGKTSLVKCGLFSKLDSERVVYFTVRSAVDPLKSLTEELAVERGIDSSPIQLIDKKARELKKTIILFFDQFEEIFTLQSPAVRSHFIATLKGMIDSNLDLRLLFNIREEYLAKLAEFEEKIPCFLDNKMWLQRMSSRQAAAGINKACQVSGVQIEEEVPRKVVAEIANASNGIELPLLQVVMDGLYQKAVKVDPEKPVIKLTDYVKLGGTKEILSDFLEKQIYQFQYPERLKQVLKALITTEGTKKVAGIAEIRQYAEYYGKKLDSAQLQNILHYLIDRRIIRQDSSNNLYELRHDSLAVRIHNWLTGTEKELAEIRLRVDNRYQEYQKWGTLLDQKALDDIRLYGDRLNLDKDQALFIEKSAASLNKQKKKKRIVLMSGMAFVLLVSTIFSALMWVQKTNSDQALEYANYSVAQALLEKARLAAEKKEWPLVKLYSAGAVLNRTKTAYHLPVDVKQPADGQNWVFSKRIECRLDGYTSFLYQQSNYIVLGDLKVDVKRDAASGKTTVLDYTNHLEIWDVEKASRVQTFQFDSLSYNLSPVISPDKVYLAVGHSNEIRLYDIQSGRTVQTFQEKSEVLSLEISPDSRLISSLSRDGTIAVREIDTGRVKFFLNSGIKEPARYFCYPLSFSPDGRILAAGSQNGAIYLWNTTDGTLIRSLADENRERELSEDTIIKTVKFSPEGQRIFTADASTIMIRSIDSGEVIAEFPGGPIFDISGGGRYVAANSGIWDIEQKEYITYIKDEPSPIFFGRNDQTLILCNTGLNSSLEVWEENTGLNRLIVKEKQDIQAVAFSGSQIAAVTGNKALDIWDIESGEQLADLENYPDQMNSIPFDWDSFKIMSNNAGGKILLLAAADREKPEAAQELSETISAARHTPDRRFLVNWCLDGKIIVLDSRDYQKKLTIESNCDWNSASIPFAVSPDSRYLANITVPADFTKDRTYNVYVSEIASGSQYRNLKLNSELYALAFSPDNKYLAVTGLDIRRDNYSPSIIYLWDLTADKLVKTIRTKTDLVPLDCLVISPDNRYLITGDNIGQIKIWDFQKGILLHTIKSAHSQVTSLNLSPDGRLLVSSGEKSIKVWNMEYLDHFYGRPLDQDYAESLMKQIEKETQYSLQGIHAVSNLEHQNSTGVMRLPVYVE